MRIYHKTARDSLASILSDGLKPGAPTGDEATRAANAYLDEHRPRRFAGGQLRRTGSIYCYLCVDGKVFDVDSGRLIDEPDWSVGDDEAKLLVRRVPEQAFVSDLDAYDSLRQRLAAGAEEAELRTLAARYWAQLVSLDDLCAGYRLVDECLVRDPHRPDRLNRAEVLVTTEIPADDLRPA